MPLLKTYMAKALESITLVENGIDITALTNPNFPPSNIFLMRISKAIVFFTSKNALCSL
jgi:hypothetical protein